MQKITLTIRGKDYPIESYNYSMHKSMDMEPNTVNSISVALSIIGRSDLDTVMLGEPFTCTLITYDENDVIIKCLVLKDAEIMSYNDSKSEQTSYSSMQIEARAAEFDGRCVTIKPFER